MSQLERRFNNFFRKTRGNSVVQCHREHYLRDDIGCGAECCTVIYVFLCRSLIPGATSSAVSPVDCAGLREPGVTSARRCRTVLRLPVHITLPSMPVLPHPTQECGDSLGMVARYIVLDTNIVLHQMDFLENRDAASALTGVIILAVRPLLLSPGSKLRFSCRASLFEVWHLAFDGLYSPYCPPFCAWTDRGA